MTDPDAPRRPGAARSAASAVRGAIRRNPKADRAYRVGVGVVGGTTTALGVVLMPLPGPGTLIALGGLAVLATEFEGAKRVSSRANDTARKAAAAAKRHRDARRARKDAAQAEADPAG
jgi:uncharacterized protein (TIGR02611 family)